MLSTSLVVIGFVAVALSWVYCGLQIVLLVENRRFTRQRTRQEAPAPVEFPHANVFIPCKGMEHRLRENITAFFRQDHPNFELTFIVEAQDDEAVPILESLIYENRFVSAKIVVAGRSENTGQKVHNLRVATENIGPLTDILAFADSDAMPNKSWLRWLTYNLGTSGLGANTGYRWMVPRDGKIWTKIGCAINNSLAAMMGRGKHFLIWGGAWAIHRKVFEASGIRQAWSGVLSDDLVASRSLHRSGLEVRFEPNCVCESHVNYSFSSLFEFMRRQFVIGRKHAPWYWRTSVVMAIANQIAIWGGLLGASYGLAAGTAWGGWLMLSTVLLYGLSVVRGKIRSQIGKTFYSGWKQERAARWLDTWGSPVVGIYVLVVMIASLFGKEISWRGIRYRIADGGDMRLIGREVDRSLWPLADEKKAVSRVNLRRAA